MHIVIPYAAPAGASIAQTLNRLHLPRLTALLKILDATGRLQGSPQNLTPLHERVMAQAAWRGEALEDGLIPWAAAEAQKRIPEGTSPASSWAWLTLCHWTPAADHVEMEDPALLQVSADESRALMDAMRGYFVEDGIALHAHADGTWLARGAVFRDLPTASLDRVRGTQVDAWIPRQAQAKPLRRLQNEMQMLLYTHPVNDARIARGLPAINAFWASGTGALPASATGLQVPQTRQPSCPKALQSAALQDDPDAWQQAWQSLDSGPIAELLALASQPLASAQGELALTLCGENAAQTFALQPRGAWKRLTSRFATPDIPTLLKSL